LSGRRQALNLNPSMDPPPTRHRSPVLEKLEVIIESRTKVSAKLFFQQNLPFFISGNVLVDLNSRHRVSLIFNNLIYEFQHFTFWLVQYQ
jgi:hypothetical protein